MCQAACSWVDVGSFHTRLFGVVYMTCGNFHDGSEKGIVSANQILCQSWEKCYRDPHNDSTSLQGPKLESCAGVSMVCPVQDRSHISWRWRTHRETQKLHNSWNCCTSSRACLSGSTSDHSWHCWGGGNWLWDMPMGSDRRIGHAPCHSQICAQDPDRWPEAAARQCLQWTSSARLQWWNLLVQGQHWWSELVLWLRPWDKATILPVEKPHVTKAKKGQTCEKQYQEHDHHFLLISRGLCIKNLSQQAKLWIPGSTATFCSDCTKTCEDTAPKKQTWLLHHDNALSHTSVLTQQFLAKNKMAVIPHPPYSPDMAPCDFFLFPKMKLKLKGRLFDTTEEIQAKLQRLLDTLIEKDFQQAFQKWRRRWDWCLHVGGNYFEGDSSR